MRVEYVKAIKEFGRLFRPVLVVNKGKEEIVVVARKNGTRLIRKQS